MFYLFLIYFGDASKKVDESNKEQTNRILFCLFWRRLCQFNKKSLKFQTYLIYFLIWRKIWKNICSIYFIFLFSTPLWIRNQVQKKWMHFIFHGASFENVKKVFYFIILFLMAETSKNNPLKKNIFPRENFEK